MLGCDFRRQMAHPNHPPIELTPPPGTMPIFHQKFKVTLLSALVSSELLLCKTTLLRKQLISPTLFDRSEIGEKVVVLPGDPEKLHEVYRTYFLESKCY